MGEVRHHLFVTHVLAVEQGLDVVHADTGEVLLLNRLEIGAAASSRRRGSPLCLGRPGGAARGPRGARRRTRRPGWHVRYSRLDRYRAIPRTGGRAPRGERRLAPRESGLAAGLRVKALSFSGPPAAPRSLP